jgi:cadmium resistance protein CadD (predicted permease)
MKLLTLLGVLLLFGLVKSRIVDNMDEEDTELVKTTTMAPTTITITTITTTTSGANSFNVLFPLLATVSLLVLKI